MNEDRLTEIAYLMSHGNLTDKEMTELEEEKMELEEWVGE